MYLVWSSLLLSLVGSGSTRQMSDLYIGDLVVLKAILNSTLQPHMVRAFRFFAWRRFFVTCSSVSVLSGFLRSVHNNTMVIYLELERNYGSRCDKCERSHPGLTLEKP